MSKVQTAIIETPFKNDNQVIKNENIIYTNLVSRVLLLEEKISTLFFHTLYVQHLDDNNDSERDIGLKMSFEHHSHVDKKVVAVDRGISQGMIYGITDALKKGTPVEFYSLDPNFNAKLKGLSLPEVQLLIGELSPNEYGDLTNYRNHRMNDINTVVKIMNEVFSPILGYASSGTSTQKAA